MNTQAPTSGRLKAILRVLSVLTLLEGALSLLAATVEFYFVPLDQQTVEKFVTRPYAHATTLLYLMASMNLVFALALFVAGVFLWRLKRKGLLLLVCTLIGEAVYFVSLSGVVMFLHRSADGASRELSKTISALTGVGNFALGLQLVTAFPIVAGVLIFFAYRYLGIPAHRFDSMKTPEWPAVTYRVFAIGNVLVVLIGLLFLLPTAWSVRFWAVENVVPTNSHFATWFWAMASINLCFLALLVVGGVHLFRLRPSGVTICNAVFVGEIIYFLVIGFLWSGLPTPVSMGVAAATGVGNMGLSPQLISGYPLVALICLNLARRRTRAQATTPLPVS